MSGRSCATEGRVLLNQEDLYKNFERLKTRMATVPQKDLLHDQLNLRSALNFTADLRLPSNSNKRQRKARVTEVLTEIEMTERADSTIATYSGGQTKRASLANELLQNPSLLFIDEATSGLDEHSDREIMSMLRRLTNAGKTVVCITHNLGNIPDYVDRLVVLTEGGHLAFDGSPDETLKYFDIDDLSQLYLRLREITGLGWAKQFRDTRKQEWLKQLKDPNRKTSESSGINQIQIQRRGISPLQRVLTIIKHSKVIFCRVALLQIKDMKSLVVALAQPILVFFLIWLVFGNIEDSEEIDKYQAGCSILFLLGISTFWFGCNNSAKELVKERELYLRERNAGLSPLAYLCSKSCFLLGLTIFSMQSSFLVNNCRHWFGRDWIGYLFVLFQLVNNCRLRGRARIGHFCFFLKHRCCCYRGALGNYPASYLGWRNRTARRFFAVYCRVNSAQLLELRQSVQRMGILFGYRLGVRVL